MASSDRKSDDETASEKKVAAITTSRKTPPPKPLLRQLSQTFLRQDGLSQQERMRKVSSACVELPGGLLLRQMHLEQVRAEQDEALAEQQVRPQYDLTAQQDQFKVRRDFLKTRGRCDSRSDLVKDSEQQQEETNKH